MQLGSKFEEQNVSPKKNWVPAGVFPAFTKSEYSVTFTNVSPKLVIVYDSVESTPKTNQKCSYQGETLNVPTAFNVDNLTIPPLNPHSSLFFVIPPQYSNFVKNGHLSVLLNLSDQYFSECKKKLSKIAFQKLYVRLTT